MNKKTLSEDEISAKFMPTVIQVYWHEATQIRRRLDFTEGGIIVCVQQATPGKVKRADSVLYSPALPFSADWAKDNPHQLETQLTSTDSPPAESCAARVASPVWRKPHEPDCR